MIFSCVVEAEMRFCLYAVVALQIAALAVGAAQAQPKKPKGKCYPNFFETCFKECVKLGGTVSGCPAYCHKEKLDRQCP